MKFDNRVAPSCDRIILQCNYYNNKIQYLLGDIKKILMLCAFFSTIFKGVVLLKCTKTNTNQNGMSC